MKNYKVFGGLTFVNGKQARTIVATKTKKKAMELLDVSVSEFNNYWGETGNGIELSVALNKPETVFFSFDTLNKVFREMK